MEQLFDTTGLIGRIAHYISRPNENDGTCFLGLPYESSPRYIAKIRKEYAKKVVRFSRMNHLGLRSNCASFAEFMRSGNVLDIVKYENYLSYFGDMYPYKGQHLNFGDMIAVHYLHDEYFNNGLFDSISRINYIHDFVMLSKSVASSRNFLQSYAYSRRKSPAYKVFGRKESIDISKNVFFQHYHYLVCVGYEFNTDTGNLEPVFVSQNGRNVLSKAEVVAGTILLPPFGDLGVSFITDHVLQSLVSGTPGLVLCSKPL